jgi:glucose-1-phosphate thymidylyltransferase
MLEANRLVLEDLEHEIAGDVDGSDIEGRVVIAAGATVERSRIRGPVIIGAGARVADAYIGPFTSIAEGAVVEASEVEHSILLEGAQVRNLSARLEASLLGRNAQLEGHQTLPRTIRMIVGDNSEIAVP